MASLNVYIVTYNCGRTLVNKADLASILFNANTVSQPPDILFLSLQEIAPIYASFIGGGFLDPYFHRVKDVVALAAAAFDIPVSYTPIAIRHVGMTALLAFARDATCVAKIEVVGTGVGVLEMGNKGGVGMRIVYRDGDASTEMTFVAAHLAAHESEIQRRNVDWKNIVRGLCFTPARRNPGPSSNSNEDTNEDERLLLGAPLQRRGIYSPTSHLFLAGDLNYRTSSVRPESHAAKHSFPQPDVPPSSAQHVSKLLEKDQLRRERLAGRTLHGLVEAPITFPPTYKYSSEEPYLVEDADLTRWNWAEHRWPSWCDRILYLEMPGWAKNERKIVVHKYKALPLMATSDHRPVAALFTIPLECIPDPGSDIDEVMSSDPRISPPFAIDPRWHTRRKTARQLELLVGLGAYLTTCWEGRFVAVATIMGAIGAWFVLKAILNF